MDRRSSASRTARVPVACILALSLVAAGVPAAASAASRAAPAVADVRTARDLAAGYMERSVRNDGRFAYLVDMDPDVEVPAEYNVLRHAGGIWAMCDYYRSRPTQKMYDSVSRAAWYLRDKRVRGVEGRSDLLAVWSDTADDGDVPSAKLGGAGLGLVALTSFERIRPGSTQLASLRALGRFIVYMQKSDGSFYTQYVPSRGGRVSTPASEYYPGEAALGLLMLYELDPQPIWIQTATKALTYLANNRNAGDVPADHWSLIANQRLSQMAPKASGQVSVPQQLLLDDVARVCESMLDDQVESGDPRYIGGFSSSGGLTAAATRLEGLQAALGTLPPGHALRPRIQEAVGEGVAFLLRWQVAEGPYAGAFPHDPDSTEIRIDYVQHALSALMRYVGEKPYVRRVAGPSRYDTALAVSRAGWPSAVEGVVIATGADYPDALAAAPLAKAFGGPVLLTGGASLDAALTEELKRLAPKRVFIAGSTRVVSDAVRAQLAALPSKPAVVRCGGADRYETAALLARQVKARLGTTPRVVVCSGANFTDGLSVAPVAAANGWPMLLAKGGTLTAATKSALAYLAPSSGVLVGTTSSLPAALEPLVPAPTRLSGADGPATSVAVATWAKANGFASVATLGLATSANFPDGLAVAPHLAREGGVLLLTPPAGLPSGTRSFVTANKAAVGRVDVVGSASALSETVVFQTGSALQ